MRIAPLTASLFKDRVFLLGSIVKISDLSLPGFIDHLAQSDINLINPVSI